MGIAIISPTGLATAVEVGITIIRATLVGVGVGGANVTGSTTLTVTLPPLVSIVVTPPNPTIAVGDTLQFEALGQLSDGTPVPLTSTATWATSSSTVATIDAAGLAAGAGFGTTTISATVGAITGATVLTVTLPSLDVTPADPFVPKGATTTFTAFATLTLGTSLDVTASSTWGSSDGDVATISNDPGSEGLAQALSVGTTIITAFFTPPGETTSVSGSFLLTVTEAEVLSIAVTPENPSIRLRATQKLRAIGTFTDGKVLPITTRATWLSSSLTVATAGGTLATKHIVTGVGEGNTTISAVVIEPTVGTIIGSTVLTVTPVIDLTPKFATTTATGTRQFAAILARSDVDPTLNQDVTANSTWASSTTSVATVSPTGLATAAGSGVTRITATFQGITGTAVFSTVPLTSVAVTADNVPIPRGLTQQFTATGTFTFDDGSTTTVDVTETAGWSSSNETVAIVDAYGLVSAVGVGVTTISAAVGTATVVGSIQLTVIPPVVIEIQIVPDRLIVLLGIGELVQLRAIGILSDDTTQDITADVTWSSSVPAVATVGDTTATKGLLTAVAVGATEITATDPVTGVVSGIFAVTVGNALPSSIAIQPDSPFILITVGTQQFEAALVFTDGSTTSVTQVAAWGSSNAVVASIDQTGLATLASVGTTTISAAFAAITGSTLLTVTPFVPTGDGVVPSDGEEEVVVALPPPSIEGLSDEDAADLLATLSPDVAAALLADLSADEAARILGLLDPDFAAEILARFAPEDAAELLNEADRNVAAEILNELDRQFAADIVTELARQDAADILVELAATDAAEIIVLLDSQVAADILEVMSDENLTAIVEAVVEEDLLVILPRMSPDKMFKIPVRVLFSKLLKAPTEQIAFEIAPRADPNLPLPIAVQVSPTDKVYLVKRTRPGRFFVFAASPAPLDRILAKTTRTLTDIQLLVEDLPLAKLAEFPPLAAGQITNSMFRLAVTGADPDDFEATHVTMSLEKSWFEANDVHKWSIQFNRFDEEENLWMPIPTKRVREDQQKIGYTLVVPGFSTIVVTGSKELPQRIFEVGRIRTFPPAPRADQDVIISSTVTNMSSQPAIYPASLWVNNVIDENRFLKLDPGETAPLRFNKIRPAGEFFLRVERQFLDLSVTAAPTATPTPLPTPRPGETVSPTPTRTPTPTPTPTATPIPPIVLGAPMPTPTPTPTPTALPPTPTPTASPVPPTATPTATTVPEVPPTATPSPTPTPTPTPEDGGGAIIVIVVVLIVVIGIGAGVFFYLRSRRQLPV